ncbi:hypothetical protein SNEBB_006802 [Seison nebaliae]|nr:hypothetical protein SNEBB_006802 [Seison nebaliae]
MVAIIVLKNAGPIVVKEQDFHTISKDFFAYFVPINLMFININTTENDEKFYVLNETMLEYMDSLKIRPFNDRFTGFSRNLENHFREVTKQHGLPKIVAISEAYGDPLSLELSYDVICELSKIFRKFYDAAKVRNKFFKSKFSKKHGQTLNNEKLDQIIKENWNDTVTVSGFRPKLPDDFWDGEIPRKQDLFRGYYKSYNQNYYTLYAFEIVVEPLMFKLNEQIINGTALPENFFFWRQRRMDELMNKAKRLHGKHLSDHDNILIEKRIRKFITPIVHKEALAMAHAYYIKQQSGLGKMTTDKFIRFEEVEKDGHGLAVIKSISTKTWYLISNDVVVQLRDLKTLLGGQYGYIIETMFWYGENSYENDIHKLRPLVEPIITKHYGLGKKNVQNNIF